MKMLVLTFGVFLGVSQVQAGTPIVWWTATSLQKIQATDPVPSSLLRTVQIYAARNEFEPFQIVMRSESASLSGIDVDCSDFRTAAGSLITKDNVVIYAEQYYSVTKPSLATGTPGDYPDALIPRIDQYMYERRNAFPLTLKNTRNQAVWIEVYVPQNAVSGD